MPDLPDHPPAGAAAQEDFVRSALTLAVHLRARSWAKADLGITGVPGQQDVPHPGERDTADAFDVLGRLMLPHASTEGWTATFVTDLARGDKTLETAIKLGKYILHPTFLALTDDTTRIIGTALHNINVSQLHKLTNALQHYATAEPPHPAAQPASRAFLKVKPEGERPTTQRSASSGSEHYRFRLGAPLSSTDRSDGAKLTPPSPPASPSAEPRRHHPRSQRPSAPGSPGRPHRP
ncbi:hypothetical protein ACIRVK_39880 [Streptomyces sp. NPDC101152]|uniref:hypothetical protein n=1 Tax=Streptomyces sp. NPDC101152 TaxID=3366116 RepID=UPI00380C25C4